jgi:hypothetical protein
MWMMGTTGKGPVMLTPRRRWYDVAMEKTNDHSTIMVMIIRIDI